jgi:hypothetical protein
MMASEVLVNEAVDVLTRTLKNGEILPTSFLWRDRSRYVADVGRRWEERISGRTVRCYLVQTVDNNTFELRWDAGGEGWSLHRAWLRDLVA